MFGSKILEVVIGMIFIFLLYSLLASSIQELLSSLYSLRARMLRKAIKRMLVDDHSYPFFKRVLLNIRSLLGSVYPPIERWWTIPVDFSSLFYRQPGIKYLGFSKRERHPAYIKAETFAKTLFDILKGNGVGNDDISKINDALLRGEFAHNDIIVTIDKETHMHIQTIWETSEQDIEKFKKTLAEWYDETMELVSFQYKKHTRTNLFIIGLLLAFVFNINTITISNNLSKDDKARAELISLSNTYLQTNTSDSIQHVDLESKTFNDTLRLQIRKVYSQIENDVYNSNNFLAVGWRIPQTFEQCRVRDSLNQKPQKGSQVDYVLWRMYKNKKKQGPVGQNQQLSRWDKCMYLLHMTCNIRYILGYLITAFAISFGAPFWFDLLAKVVKLKNTSKESTTTK
jgi:hypothetical protein